MDVQASVVAVRGCICFCSSDRSSTKLQALLKIALAPATDDVIPATDYVLACNEMLLTGESEDVPKKYNAAIHPAGAGKPAKLTASNMVFSSTTITAGNARGIVVETAKSGKDASAEEKWIRNPLGDCMAKH
ncbi:hypothetical protein PInf_011904 [Phytophthora infestans]|nr:hypothetical protein PInf_011904 [Phytophthora infestans]